MSAARWIAYSAKGVRVAARSTRSAAMNALRRPYYVAGRVTVVNDRTGEAWVRIKGSWFPVEDEAK